MAKQIEIVATMKAGNLIPLDLFADKMSEYKDGQQVLVFIEEAKPEKIRTKKQQASIEVYCSKVAKACDDAGYGLRHFMTKIKQAEIPLSQAIVKEVMWKTLQLTMTGVKSSTKISTVQTMEVYEVCNRFTAERLGFSIPWPCRESQSYEDNRY
jgi:hypothetical protein